MRLTNLGKTTSIMSLYKPRPSLLRALKPTWPASPRSSPKFSMASTNSPEVLSLVKALKKDSSSFLSLSASPFQVGFSLMRD